ncbi:hypothetical protein EVAR_89017_1 [Eumeta japonica]|uniref:Uncharacterized protein n=1 Tax=Eumeta variegata TaxID=151549 RepID=A0A4C1X820_EUMVA|nr:hypothetical protein EVAR_89017_1 [Eumeta japonica]
MMVQSSRALFNTGSDQRIGKRNCTASRLRRAGRVNPFAARAAPKFKNINVKTRLPSERSQIIPVMNDPRYTVIIKPVIRMWLRSRLWMSTGTPARRCGSNPCESAFTIYDEKDLCVICVKWLRKIECRNSDVREQCGVKEDVVTGVEGGVVRWSGI